MKNVFRELEEGCNIRIVRLAQMMDVMSVEKHIDSTFEGGKGEKLSNIHFLAFLAVDIFYISNDDFKRTEGPF